jgi:hypothetical protein
MWTAGQARRITLHADPGCSKFGRGTLFSETALQARSVPSELREAIKQREIAMKTNFALAAAAMIVLGPAVAAAAQPAPAPDQSAPQAQNPAKAPAATPKKDSGQADASCDATGKPMGKSADSKVQHDPSAPVGKDTGVLPPSRKKPASNSESGCTAQPQ